ncbi:helix-turn-helix domain-containing protein [Fuchsiella alkaliacetigena]|uniref:helix-turn-helix domain-containing protein n=1 Tax=Fuchsiella alkaliacetigena TaxID=957042 RepID=UPI00200A2FC7|nr:helix-turn-helix transcriptional regulator [Fuchsiella alkaliacetigena]MCK8823991.1 helix-turn-helix transcriptional regulator [Fuchsiella alkaliacetigena]
MKTNFKSKEFKRIMNEKGLNEAQMADKLGVDVSYIYRLLNGERQPGRKFILAAVDKLDLSVADLFESSIEEN